jgi:hypothetical protein
MRIPFLANYKVRLSLGMRSYLGVVVGCSPAEYRIESSPMVIASPLNGGAGFAGKSGRKTANACETNAMETSTNTAAHFMSAALSKIKQYGKQNFRAITVIRHANVTGDLLKRYILRKVSFNFVTFLTIQPRDARF